VKIAILLVALALAAGNLLRTKPRLASAELGAGAAVLLRRLISGETVLVAGAVAAAAVLSSLPPPAAALAKAGGAIARVGPGRVVRTVQHNGYTLRLRVDPNRAAVPNEFALEILRGGKPVRGADVTATFAMLDMEMGEQAYHLAETSPGVYSHSAPALVMVGHWGLDFDVQARGHAPFQFEIVDHATG
jgi:copper transport protein